jgi:hypothetical protein
LAAKETPFATRKGSIEVKERPFPAKKRPIAAKKRHFPTRKSPIEAKEGSIEVKKRSIEVRKSTIGASSMPVLPLALLLTSHQQGAGRWPTRCSLPRSPLEIFVSVLWRGTLP